MAESCFSSLRHVFSANGDFASFKPALARGCKTRPFASSHGYTVTASPTPPTPPPQEDTTGAEAAKHAVVTQMPENCTNCTRTHPTLIKETPLIGDTKIFRLKIRKTICNPFDPTKGLAPLPPPG